MAPSLAMSNVRSDQNYPNGYGCGIFLPGDARYDDQYTISETLSSTKFQMVFTTGLHYRPSARNTLGLKFWLAPKKKESDSLMSRYAYGYALPQRSYEMRSLQVVLRHSWK